MKQQPAGVGLGGEEGGATLDREQGQEFLRRWREVERAQDKEWREMPVEVRFRRFLAAQHLAAVLGMVGNRGAQDQAGEREVRGRWRRLRVVLGPRGSP